MYNLPPPKSFNPSPLMMRFSDRIAAAPAGKIFDVGCGFGRNGSLFASQGKNVVFVDKSLEATEYLKRTYAGNPHVEVRCKDAFDAGFLKDDDTISGIIMVHFYSSRALESMIKRIVPNGFLFIETIDDRGGNYLELPRTGFIREIIGNEFDLEMLQEKISRHDSTRSTMKVFAVRKNGEEG